MAVCNVHAENRHPTPRLSSAIQMLYCMLQLTAVVFQPKPFGKKKNNQLAGEHCEAFRAREIPREMVAIKQQSYNPHPNKKF